MIFKINKLAKNYFECKLSLNISYLQYTVCSIMNTLYIYFEYMFSTSFYNLYIIYIYT
jgi:hypothetical protein